MREITKQDIGHGDSLDGVTGRSVENPLTTAGFKELLRNVASASAAVTREFGEMRLPRWLAGFLDPHSGDGFFSLGRLPEARARNIEGTIRSLEILAAAGLVEFEDRVHPYARALGTFVRVTSLGTELLSTEVQPEMLPATIVHHPDAKLAYLIPFPFPPN